MVETNEELKLGIGNEEAVTLKPAIVKITDISIEEVGAKKSKKVICSVKHPDNPEPIKISGMKYENKGKLEISGLWINKDSRGLIRKGSALAILMNTLGVQQIGLLAGKDIPTIQDEKGYLVFKVY